MSSLTYDRLHLLQLSFLVLPLPCTTASHLLSSFYGPSSLLNVQVQLTENIQEYNRKPGKQIYYSSIFYINISCETH
jgi:hypothetical protein